MGKKEGMKVVLKQRITMVCGILKCSKGPLPVSSVIGGASDQTDSDRMETVVKESWSTACKPCSFIAEESIEFCVSYFFCFSLHF